VTRREGLKFISITVALLLQWSTPSFAVWPFKGTTEQNRVQQCAVLLSAVSQHKIDSFDDLLKAFSNGFVPNLKDKSQRDAFEIYRRMRFGDPNTNLNANSIDTVGKELQSHPELQKETFRNFDLEVQERTYPVTPELKAFIDGQVKNAGQVRSNLFQIDANLGYWKKILQYEDHEIVVAKPQSKEEQKQARKLENERFINYLNKIISPETRASIADSKVDAKGRARILYKVLTSQRDILKAQNKDTRPISQSIVDLIHTIGFHDPVVQRDLKSANGMDRINAIRRVLSERDSFAMELGFKNHFEEMKNYFAVNLPSGIESAQTLTQVLPKLQADVESKAQVVTTQAASRTIRHLSIVESPFRSCLGGSDCSSRTYLTRGLDPNYHYFTMTDSQGYSSGHFTVVLGDATAQKSNGSKEKVKMAFIDKVQNVPNNDIPFMMEGVRRSLLEKGYILALPEDVGDHNGLSNEDMTRSFVKANVKTDSDTRLVNFKPHAHKYAFPNQYSRAEQGLPSRPVLPLKDESAITFTPENMQEPWSHPGFDLTNLVAASYKLKDGTTEDKLRYLPSMKAIQVAGLKVDPAFGKTLETWLADEKEPIQLRRQILLYQWKEENKSLPDLLNNFSKTDQINILQNLLDTPRYKDALFKQKKDLWGLMIRARTNKKVRDQLALQLYPRYMDQIDKILDAPDIDDARAKLIIESMEAGYEATDIEEASKFPTFLKGTSIEAWVNQDLPDHYLKNVLSETVFGRNLVKGITSQDVGARNFAAVILGRALHDERFQDFGIVRALAEIGNQYNWDSRAWLSATQDIELKSEFIFAHYFSRPDLFDEYMKSLNPNEKIRIEDYVAGRTSLGISRRMAEERGVPEKIMEKAKPETFDFARLTFPKEGKKFVMGSPPNEPGRQSYEFSQREVTLTKPFEIGNLVTQLEYYLATGKAPSNFKGKEHADGDHATVNGIEMNINHPVEQVSEVDAEEYCKIISKRDPKYNYRLPTEAEMELAARGGTSTAYSYGDDPNSLGDHAWFSGNSGNRTHAIATKKPNPLGLYDVHGNVWVWTSDLWDGNPNNSPTTNPTGASAGSNRVIRGGSWFNYAQDLRSAYRDGYGLGERNYAVGFRVVRTPK